MGVLTGSIGLRFHGPAPVPQSLRHFPLPSKVAAIAVVPDLPEGFALFGAAGNPDMTQRFDGIVGAAFALLICVGINAIILRWAKLGTLPALITGYFLVFSELAVAGGLSYYLGMSAFTLSAGLFVALAVGAAFLLTTRRVRLVLPGRRAVATMGFAIWPIALGTVLVANSGDFMVYGADSSWYASAARQMLTIDQYYLDNLGSPYHYEQVDATASMIQALQAFIARLAHADILAVATDAMRLAAPLLLFATVALFFRAVGLGPCWRSERRWRSSRSRPIT